MVRGLPGSGKTTLMHYLAYRFASMSVKGQREWLPLYLRLRDFCCTKKSLKEFVRQQINEYSDSPEMCDTLCDKRRFLEQPMIVLLDGLDEIEDKETNDNIKDLLNEFAKNHPRCNIIVTSRPIGLRREDYPRYRSLNLLPLNVTTIKTYIDRWFAGDVQMGSGRAMLSS